MAEREVGECNFCAIPCGGECQMPYGVSAETALKAFAEAGHLRRPWKSYQIVKVEAVTGPDGFPTHAYHFRHWLSRKE
jgi:hypothetical protein